MTTCFNTVIMRIYCHCHTPYSPLRENDVIHKNRKYITYSLLIDLTAGEHLQILGERRGGMGKSGIFNTKTSAISDMKQSRANVTTKCLQKLVYNLSIGDKSGDIG